jgi:uncharacterized protein YjiS (DUF1127 family)
MTIMTTLNRRLSPLPALFDTSLAVNHLRSWWERRRNAGLRRQATKQLAALSPHLLSDIGICAWQTPDASQVHLWMRGMT